MFDKEILNYKDLDIKISDFANEDILFLLNNTVLGSEGGMRYSLQNINTRINEYGDKIRFISLYLKGQLAGTIGACYRITGQGKLKVPSSYLRYLAFQPLYQSEQTAGGSRRELKREEKEDSFRYRVLELFGKPHMLGFEPAPGDGKHILYAFIESMNERSKNLVHQAGYEYVRSFLTVAFSRFSPVVKKGVEPLPAGEIPFMTQLLNEFYRDYSLFTTEYAFLNRKYYVLREKGEIIAGAAAIPSAYKIFHIPGVWGWVITKVLPETPFYKRIFKPDMFRFLVFDAIYCKEGMESRLPDLFESMCASEGFNTGLTWLDDRSRLYEELRTGAGMGALNRMLNAKPGLVYIRFVNFSEEEKDIFFDSPAYISGFDFS